MFKMIRLWVRNAVLAGVADAMDQLEGYNPRENDEAEKRLESRLKALPDHSARPTDIEKKRRNG